MLTFKHIALVSCIPLVLLGQTEDAYSMEWVSQFGTERSENTRSSTIDGNGNLFVTGLTYGAFDGETKSSEYDEEDVFIAKYNKNGVQQWIKQFGTDAINDVRSIAVDESGYVFVVGSTTGTFSGQTNNGDYDAFIAKYDTDGNEQWIIQFGTEQGEGGSSITTDGDYLFVTGGTKGAFEGYTHNSPFPDLGSGSDVFIAKYDKNGNKKWILQFGTNSLEMGNSITTDEEGDLFVTGFTGGEFDGETQNGTLTADVFIAKYDSSGEKKWIRQFGTALDEYPSSITSGGTDIFVTGETRGGEFSGETTSGGTDTFIAKYNIDGDQKWVKQYGTDDKDYGRSITTDEIGDLFVTGETHGTFAGETNRGGSIDAYIAKYDSTGEKKWIRQFGTDGYDYADSISTDGTGNLFVGGGSSGTFPGEVANPSYDAFIAKFSTNIVPEANAGEDQDGVVGDEVVLNGSGTDVNVGEILTYSWTLAVPGGSLSTLSDLSIATPSFTPDIEGIYTATLTVNDGTVDSTPDSVIITVIPIVTATTDTVEETISAINAMDPESFSNPNAGNALTNKLNSILDMINAGEYQEALDKLENDILPKTDGCTLDLVGTPDKQDWIEDCDEQKVVYDYVNELIDRLNSLINS